MRISGVRRYQRSNQHPYIEEEQTTQWPKEEKHKRTNNDLQNIHLKLKSNTNPTKTGDGTGRRSVRIRYVAGSVLVRLSEHDDKVSGVSYRQCVCVS